MNLYYKFVESNLRSKTEVLFPKSYDKGHDPGLITLFQLTIVVHEVKAKT